MSPTHVWAIALGALVMIIIAFSYAYMVPKYPKAGGEFTWQKYGVCLWMVSGRGLFDQCSNEFDCNWFNCGWLRWISRYFKMGVALSGGR